MAGKVRESLALKLALAYLKAEEITPKPASINPKYLQLSKRVFRSFQANDGGYSGADSKGYQVLVNFRRPGSFRTVTMADVLANRVNPSWMRDRIVLIGSTAPGLQDFFYTPYSNSAIATAQPLSGVKLNANFVSQILSSVLSERPIIKVWPNLLEWLWIFSWTLLGAELIWQMPLPRRAFGSLLLTTMALEGMTYHAPT
jgi:CHASE2 domain-containing sensor protein